MNRLLTVSASLLALASATVAFCMAFPVRWDGIGICGAAALHFPVHLLVGTLVAAVLMFISARRRARFAARSSLIVVVLTAMMALIPSVAIWRQARAYNVPLSITTYLANARQVNSGAPRTDKSVVYGTARSGEKLELDVWRIGVPDSGPLRPAIVLVHGGGWVHGTRSMLPEWDRWLNTLGYEVFDVEYRMPPPARWLDEVGDVKAALGWVAAHADDYHVAPNRISVMGNSAGANLAMLAAYSAGDSQLPPSTNVPSVPIHSVISLYGPCDVALLYRTSPSRDYVQSVSKKYVGGTADEFPERYRLISPLSHVDANSPPTIQLLGTTDRIVGSEQARLLDQAFTKAGVAHETYLLPGNDHGFDINWGGFGTQIARAKIKAFLERY